MPHDDQYIGVSVQSLCTVTGSLRANVEHNNGMRLWEILFPDSLIPLLLMIQDTGSDTRV